MAKFQEKEMDQSMLLEVTGELTIAHATAFKEALVAWSGQKKALLLDLEGLTDIDCTGIQLLCATRQEVVKQGRTIQLFHPIPEPILNRLKNIGLSLEWGEPSIQG